MMKQSNERYRMIIVDDEPLILRSVRAAIPWDELGIDIVGEARNGKDALALMEKHSPHIILSDIRMPSMDGIALMQQALSVKPEMIFIIVSGYGEFEYAREALRFGAFDYLLKPIDHDELLAMIQAAIRKLEQEKKQKEEAEMLAHSVQTMSTLARERLYADLIEGNAGPAYRLPWLESCELQRSYYMILVRLDRFESVVAGWSESDRRLWFFVIRNILEEIGEQHGALAVFPFHNGEWVMLAPRVSDKEKVKIGQEIVHAVLTCTHLSCSVGLSRDFVGLDRLSACYESAKQALYRQFIDGEGGVYIVREKGSSRDNPPHSMYPIDIERKMNDAVKALNEDRFVRLWDEWKREMENRARSKLAVERMTVELLVSLYRRFEHWNEESRFPLEELFAAMKVSGSLAEMIETFKQTLRAWLHSIRATPPREDGKKAIEKAKEYIENYYHKDMGMDEVAEAVQLSVSHFCSLFKQESGYTFLEYLTKCRIEKACFMLRNTDVKVYQIAPLVGYQDAKYFTQVFKKLVGMTPTEYREGGRSPEDALSDTAASD